uniref:FAD dependent oxidoreductase domain-containing protein n=1 Tax=Buteo japonicus TaxID=224669 RepID=A0A8C0BDX0_9AVES
VLAILFQLLPGSLLIVKLRCPNLKWRRMTCSRRSTSSTAEPYPVSLPAQAHVVICGGGIMGTSVAYHLSKMGWKDIVLLEQALPWHGFAVDHSSFGRYPSALA